MRTLLGVLLVGCVVVLLLLSGQLGFRVRATDVWSGGQGVGSVVVRLSDDEQRATRALLESEGALLAKASEKIATLQEAARPYLAPVASLSPAL